MNTEKYYYKITSIDGTEFYISTDLPLKSNKLCEFLGLDVSTAVEITKDEFFYDENNENT